MPVRANSCIFSRCTQNKQYICDLFIPIQVKLLELIADINVLPRTLANCILQNGCNNCGAAAAAFGKRICNRRKVLKAFVFIVDVRSKKEHGILTHKLSGCFRRKWTRLLYDLD